VIIKKYIIVAHDNPFQLKRLIERLDGDKVFFYIHIDLKSDLNSFSSIIDKKNIIFINERVDCIWGDFSMAIATISLLKNAIADKIPDSRIILLSGHDYPIRNNEHIDEYLSQNREYEFINFVLDPIPLDHDMHASRVKQYKINFSSKRGDFILLDGGFSNSNSLKILLRLFIKRRIKTKDLFNLLSVERKNIFIENYKGSNWLSLTYATTVKVLDYIHINEKKLYNYYTYTLCAEELFFHTILKKIMEKDISIKVKPNLHFIDWDRKNVPLPVTFKREDIQLLMQQPAHKLFARKFDVSIDEHILDLLDEKMIIQ